ncbi:ROK family protein [Mycoplasma sp. SG1]|uniref:ROK family protein n=1 Tax=Mycoplasma sp. SG1 TaxID=2810348 RepID=UPI002025A6F9|nr:ROK family protein [Mycoplasma sp. SG1]URM53226.1 ROK family protein [Mycoplasma sp. SG1]
MVLAIDLGGTTTKLGLFTKDGKLLHTHVCDTVVGKVIEEIHNSVKKWLSTLNLTIEKDISSIGFACVGPIDPEKGISLMAKKINWVNYPALEVCKKYFKKPIYLTNDSRAAIVGEFWKGAGQGYKNVIGYTLGTGVGGGVILNNKIYYGSHYWAGEFGHGGHMQDEYDCLSCGLPHCMEGLSSAVRIEKYMRQYIDKNPNSDLAKLQKNIDHPLTIFDVQKMIKQDHKETTEILRYCLRPLGSHIAIMMYSIDPDVVLIGGGPSALGDYLLKHIHYWIEQYARDFVYKKIPIKVCQLGNQAGIYGAAWTAIQGLKNKS